MSCRIPLWFVSVKSSHVQKRQRAFWFLFQEKRSGDSISFREAAFLVKEHHSIKVVMQHPIRVQYAEPGNWDTVFVASFRCSFFFLGDKFFLVLNCKPNKPTAQGRTQHTSKAVVKTILPKTSKKTER